MVAERGRRQRRHSGRSEKAGPARASSTGCSLRSFRQSFGEALPQASVCRLAGLRTARGQGRVSCYQFRFSASLHFSLERTLMRSARADDWHDAVSCLEPLLLEGAPIVKGWEATTAPLWVRPTTVVLHGRATRIGAIDLESKFTEAALGHLQVADYRNFAHGRHHWLAKRGATSGVLAFITESDREIAERTLEAIPSDIPQARVVFEGRPNTVALASLLAALRLSGWAGSSRGIDPGRPGVPEFGRKLYRMPLSAPRRETEVPGLGQRESASISRKAGVGVSRLAASGELASWRDAYSAFTRRLCEGRFVGVVLDYDGTVVDARDRFVPARPRIATELLRIAQSGALIGVATGRGASVRRDLQKCLPRSIWPRFVIGYYNGADIAALDDDGAPDGSHNVCAALEGLADALRSQAELATSVRQHDRRFQITLEAIRPISEERLWTLVSDIVRQAGNDEISLTCSSHSIDIISGWSIQVECCLADTGASNKRPSPYDWRSWSLAGQ